SPRVRSQPLNSAIHTIPYEIIAAFMSKPMVLEKNQVKTAPHVVASRDQHLVASAGNTIYARGNDEFSANAGAYYNIVNVGDPLRDPDKKDVVGYQGIYTAKGKVTRGGETATLQLTESERETLDGDKLFPDEPAAASDFMPRAPDKEIEGR